MFWRLAHELSARGAVGWAAAAPRPMLAAALLLGCLGGVVAGRLGRTEGSVVLGALAGSALAVAVSLTLFRVGVRPGGQRCAVTDPVLLSSDGLANLVLFAPAAFLGALAVGRPLFVTAGVAAVSVGVEALQQLLAVGVCDTSDALLNALGGLVGAGVARCAAAWSGSVPGSSPCRRSC